MKIGKYIRTIIAAIGLIVLYDVVGKIMYYGQIGESEPASVWVLAVVGVAMMLPGVLANLVEEEEE